MKGGVSLPFIFVVFGQMTDDFVSIGKYANCFNIDNDTYQPNDQGMFKIVAHFDRYSIEFSNTPDVLYFIVYLNKTRNLRTKYD